MDFVPIRPALARPAQAAARAGSRTAGGKAAVHAAAAHHPAAAATPDDIALLAAQADFDRMMQVRAEIQREANALRDLAMEQVKRDDAVMNQWIKLI